MKKNVLILSYTYPPSNAPAAQRPYTLAKYLDKERYNVRVITCSNADSSLGFDEGFDPELPAVRLISIPSKVGSGIGSFRKSGMVTKTKKKGWLSSLKGWVFRTVSGLILPDKAVFWTPNVKKFLREHRSVIDEADILFTTSPLFTNHLLGHYVKKRNPRVQWIADLRDFHGVAHWSEQRGYKARYHTRLEKRLMQSADRITFISGAMEEAYAQAYPEHHEKMGHVYNGFDPDEFIHARFDGLDQEQLVIFYAGSFYKGVRSPLPLLELLDHAFDKHWIEPSQVSIRIAGNFDQELLQEAEKRQSFRCIDFLGLIPRTEVLEHLRQSHVLWLIVGNKINHYAGVPIKFYEYLGSRRTILNFAPSKSEPSRIIDKYQLGVNIESNPFQVAQAEAAFKVLIDRFLSGDLKDPLNDAALNEFNRKNQARQFEALL